MDVDGNGSCPLDDAGPLVLLRRDGALEECHLNHAAELHRLACDQYSLGVRRVQSCIWRKYRRLHRKPTHVFHVSSRR